MFNGRLFNGRLLNGRLFGGRLLSGRLFGAGLAVASRGGSGCSGGDEDTRGNDRSWDVNWGLLNWGLNGGSSRVAALGDTAVSSE